MVKLLYVPSSSSIFSIFSLSKKLSPRFPSLTRPFSQHKPSFPSTTMSINLQSHTFAGNPLRSKSPKPGDPFSPIVALETLKTRILVNTHHSLSPNFKVLPFRNGRPLASSTARSGGNSVPSWRLGWIGLNDLKGLLGNCGAELSGDSLVYLGSSGEEDAVYWAIDVSGERGLVPELGSMQFCFVELRTLMVATDWADLKAMGNLAIAGYVGKGTARMA